jgi:hypothetical protein
MLFNNIKKAEGTGWNELAWQVLLAIYCSSIGCTLWNRLSGKEVLRIDVKKDNFS